MIHCLAGFSPGFSMLNSNYECELSQKSKFSVSKAVVSTIPWLIVSGLLWAGIFVKPVVTIKEVEKPAIEPRDNIYGVDVVDKKTIWLAGSYGKVLLSNDGGSSWKIQDTNIVNHIQDISSWDNERAISVGNSGVVIRTEDSGKTWKEVDVPKNDIANKLLRVHTYSDGEAWAVGEFGTILKTSNYGLTWEKMRENEDVILNDLIKVGSEKIIVVGEFGTILSSEDGGLTWGSVELSFDIESSLMAIEFSDELHGMAVGLDGLIIKTENGGATWEKVLGQGKKITEHLMDVIWDQNKEIWFSVGNKGVWVEVNKNHDSLKSGVFDKMDLSWHTEINFINGEYLAVGANVGVYNPEDNNFIELSHKLVR